jgi:hypothetical protein
VDTPAKAEVEMIAPHKARRTTMGLIRKRTFKSANCGTDWSCTGASCSNDQFDPEARKAGVRDWNVNRGNDPYPTMAPRWKEAPRDTCEDFEFAGVERLTMDRVAPNRLNSFAHL